MSSDHALITWLNMLWSRGWSCTYHVAYHTLITWPTMHWSRSWPCTDHVAEHAMITMRLNPREAALEFLRSEHKEEFAPGAPHFAHTWDPLLLSSGIEGTVFLAPSNTLPFCPSNTLPISPELPGCRLPHRPQGRWLDKERPQSWHRGLFLCLEMWGLWEFCQGQGRDFSWAQKPHPTTAMQSQASQAQTATPTALLIRAGLCPWMWTLVSLCYFSLISFPV